LLQDVQLSHHWGTDIITIQGNGIIKTITITKHLNSKTKRPEIFLCYDFQNGFTKEEEDIACATEPNLFSIDTLSLSIVQQFEPLMSIKPKSTFTFLVSNLIFLESRVPHKSIIQRHFINLTLVAYGY
jgi:hypothetical protein